MVWVLPMGSTDLHMAGNERTPIIFLPFFGEKSGKTAEKDPPHGENGAEDHPDPLDQEDVLMLEGEAIMRKLQDYASMFRSACYSGQWARAKFLYLAAHYTALTVEMDEDQIAELFGNDAMIPEDEEPNTGLFPQKLVDKAGWQCIMRHLTLDELHLHPREQVFQHGEGDCITAVCTKVYPNGIPIAEWLRAKK